jgi:hypothetical protein
MEPAHTSHPPDHSPTIHVVRRVARIQPTGVRAERAHIAERIHLLVVEVVVAHGICAEFRVILVRRQHQPRTTAPPAHELRRNQPLVIRGYRILAEVGAEHRHVFLQPAVRHVTAVARQHLGFRQIGDEPVLVGIAQDERPGSNAAPEPGVGSSPEPFITGCDNRSRKPKWSWA